jgi:catechol 2,3-dioxygenase-like lactoylglutathione lyase family enzyme
MELRPPALPFLVVDDPAPCRDFWVSLLGFSVPFEDHRDGALDFVVLQGPSAGRSDPVTLEYQRFAGLAPSLRERLTQPSRSVVYTWVQGLGELEHAVRARQPGHLVERRTAPYGAEELVVSDPHGHLFVFGERAAVSAPND